MKRGAAAAISALLVAGLGWYYHQSPEQQEAARGAPALEAPGGAATAPVAPMQAVAADYRDGQQLVTRGRVIRILSDDRDGSAHQRFIIQLDGGNTLLIAHNIDLAPRLAGLTVGESVIVAGEFAPNDRGGLVHWTHHDPAGRHVPGYIEWRGRRYQ
jgi:hypothetical protein